MPSQSEGAQAGSVLSVDFRILDSRVSLQCVAGPVRERLAQIGPDAQPAFPVRRRLKLAVTPVPGGYSVRQDDRWFYSCPNQRDLALFLHQHLQRSVLLGKSDSILLHSAYLVWGGRGVLLVGDSGAGKTTLATRHVLDGGEAPCDDLVLIGEQSVTPFPRRFHVKTSSLGWVPELESMRESSYLYPSRHEDFFFFSPSSVRPSWSVAPRPVDALVRLSREGVGSGVRPISKWDMTRSVLSQIRNMSPATSAQMGPLLSLIQRSPCGEVGTEGDPRRSLHAISRFLV